MTGKPEHEDAQATLWRFARGDIAAEEFEAWLYASTDAEGFLGEDAFVDAVSVDFRSPKACKALQQSLYALLLERREHDCYCVTLPRFAMVTMYTDRAEELFETLTREVRRGGHRWWLSAHECSACGQWWLIANEAEICDQHIMRRMDPDEVTALHVGNEWPTDFDRFGTLLELERAAGYPTTTFLNVMAYYAASQMTREASFVDSIAAYYGVDVAVAGAIATYATRFLPGFRALEPRQIWDVLQCAISNCGRLVHLDLDRRPHVYFHFEDVQLYQVPRPGQPPPGRVALVFSNVACLELLEFGETTRVWPPRERNPDLLDRTPMELPLVRGQLYINDEARIDALRAGAVRRRDLIPPTASIAKFRVGLRGLGNHGVHIAAAELVVFIDGDTPTEDIAPMHKAWWWYYEDYCRRRGTASALPLDRTCEATLAAGLTDRSE